jgi:hypothetical protein
MPISNYDPLYGNKPGAASEALGAMRKRYGQKKGTSVFYATANKRKKRHGSALAGAIRKAR